MEIFRQLPGSLGTHDTPGPRRPSASSGCSAASGCGRDPHQGADPGAAGARRSSDHPAPGAPGPGIQEHCPESAEEAVTLLEDLGRELDEPAPQVGRDALLLCARLRAQWTRQGGCVHTQEASQDLPPS